MRFLNPPDKQTTKCSLMNKIKAITPKTKNLNDNIEYKICYTNFHSATKLKFSTEPIMESCAVDDNPQLKPDQFFKFIFELGYLH